MGLVNCGPQPHVFVNKTLLNYGYAQVSVHYLYLLSCYSGKVVV